MASGAWVVMPAALLAYLWRNRRVPDESLSTEEQCGSKAADMILQGSI
ncbi:hypothetical protein QF002_001453 [Paraburkholderia youngii]